MAGAAIRELGQFFRILCGSLAMAGQTPSHVHHLWVYGNLNGRHIAVTALAVQACSNMGPVDEVYEVGNLRNGYPFDGFIFFNVLY